MSNQVYSNSSTKYWGLAGFNSYRMSSDFVISGATSTVYNTIPYNTPSTVQGPQLMKIDSPGVFVIQSAGMYSINARVGFNAVNANTDPEITIYVVINTAIDLGTDQRLAGGTFRTPNTGSGAGFTFAQPLSFTGFLDQGDVVRIQVKNDDIVSTNTLTIKESSSGLIFTKIY